MYTPAVEPFEGFALSDDMEAALTREERFAPGPPGDPDVRVVVFRPNSAAGTLPLVLSIHGGGFGLRADTFPSMDADFAMLGALVVSVDYRSLPTTGFPQQPEDCYAAFCWAVKELDVDPGRVVVTGASAGGALAAAVTLMARDRGGPAIALQALSVPVLDDRCATRSMEQWVDTPPFASNAARGMWESYLGSGADRTQVSPYAAPTRAESVAGLPRAFISVGDCDCLRDEGIEYAMRLLGEGIPVELYCAPGQFHGAYDDARAFRQRERLLHEAIAAAIATP